MAFSPFHKPGNIYRGIKEIIEPDILALELRLVEYRLYKSRMIESMEVTS